MKHEGKIINGRWQVRLNIDMQISQKRSLADTCRI
jgi:hypothetical protein